MRIVLLCARSVRCDEDVIRKFVATHLSLMLTICGVVLEADQWGIVLPDHLELTADFVWGMNLEVDFGAACQRAFTCQLLLAKFFNTAEWWMLSRFGMFSLTVEYSKSTMLAIPCV